jgi:hypothetical protein
MPVGFDAPQHPWPHYHLRAHRAALARNVRLFKHFLQQVCVKYRHRSGNISTTFEQNRSKNDVRCSEQIVGLVPSPHDLFGCMVTAWHRGRVRCLPI